MKEFESLDKRKINEVENDILKYWEENKIFEKSIENRSKDNNFVFYDDSFFSFQHVHHLFWYHYCNLV